MESFPAGSELGIEQDVSAPLARSATPNLGLSNDKNMNVNEHELIDEGERVTRVGRKSRRALHTSIHMPQQWELTRKPYHDYVHCLVGAGWDSLKELDDYMSTGTEIKKRLIVSVLDITIDFQAKRRPDIYDELSLHRFLNEESRDGITVRLYMVEQEGGFSADIMEAFGSSLRLNPMFFQDTLTGNKSSLTPSQRHRSPFITIQAMIPKEWGNLNDPGRCTVSIYIQPDESESGWTGVVLFDSCMKTTKWNSHLNLDPPSFGYSIPPPKPLLPQTFREVFIDTFEFMDPRIVAQSPFYAIGPLFRISHWCWNQVIIKIREEDRRIKGISNDDTSISETIQTLLGLVRRRGSFQWRGRDEPHAIELEAKLEEDFMFVLEESDLLWRERERVAAITGQKAQARRTTRLTNAFTFFFVPITIVTSAYAMQVSEITDNPNNPNIWQFFCVLVGLIGLLFSVLGISEWLDNRPKQERSVKAMMRIFKSNKQVPPR